MGVIITTPPTGRVLDIASDMAEQLNFPAEELPDETDLIGKAIDAATQTFQKQADKVLLTTGFRQYQNRFPAGRNPIRLDRPPLLAVSAVKYLDGLGTLQTLPANQYVVDATQDRGAIHPASGYSWPAALDQVNAVYIDFTAGFGDPADVPESIKQFLKQWVAHWYEHRESAIEVDLHVMPHGAEAIFWSERSIDIV